MFSKAIECKQTPFSAGLVDIETEVGKGYKGHKVDIPKTQNRQRNHKMLETLHSAGT